MCALVEACEYYGFCANVYHLSLSDDYRSEVSSCFADLGINPSLDFYQCNVPARQYGLWDNSFFVEAEEFVHQSLIGKGLDSGIIENLINLRLSSLKKFPFLLTQRHTHSSCARAA